MYFLPVECWYYVFSLWPIGIALISLGFILNFGLEPVPQKISSHSGKLVGWKSVGIAKYLDSDRNLKALLFLSLRLRAKWFFKGRSSLSLLARGCSSLSPQLDYLRLPLGSPFINGSASRQNRTKNKTETNWRCTQNIKLLFQRNAFSYESPGFTTIASAFFIA